MKYLIACLLIIPQFLIAQKQFAPLDATWRYQIFEIDCFDNILKYTVEKEIEVNGNDCSIIYAYTSFDNAPFTKSQDSLIVWEDNQKVYFYQNDSFYLMFDFTIEEGDYLDYYLPYGKGYFSPYLPQSTNDVPFLTSLYIHEVEEINVNGINLKKFKTEFTFSSHAVLNNMDYIIENVGSINGRLLGQDEEYIAIGCGPYFLCHEKVDYSYPPDMICEGPTNTSNIYSENEIRFYPNPTYGDLTIENNTSEEIQRIELINMNGQKIAEFGAVKSSIQIDHIPKGLYIINLIFDSGNIHYSKIVKY